jgi:integrase/recombinase XerD
MPGRSTYIRPTPPTLPKAYARRLMSYQLALEAANRSPRTIETYLESLTRFGEYLVTHALPTDLRAIRQEHIQGFTAELLEHYTPNTADNRFRALRTYFQWLVDEQELDRSPMPRQAPRVPEQPPDVLTVEQLKALQRTCRGTDFMARRDWAILATLMDTWVRREELAGLTTADVDLAHRQITVTGKGGSRRTLQLGRIAAQAIDRYDVAREQHRDAASAAFWLGQNGPMTGSGIYQVVTARAKQAGITAYTHLFRHTGAHHFLAEGGQEGDLRVLMGWSHTSPMTARYGRSMAAERARKAKAALSPLDTALGKP